MNKVNFFAIASLMLFYQPAISLPKEDEGVPPAPKITSQIFQYVKKEGGYTQQVITLYDNDAVYKKHTVEKIPPCDANCEYDLCEFLYDYATKQKTGYYYFKNDLVYKKVTQMQ